MLTDRPLFPLADPHYPFPHHHVDVVVLTIIDKALHFLMMREEDAVVGSRLVLPGAFVHERKPFEWFVRKILKEKAKIGSEVVVEPLPCFSNPDRDPRAWILSSTYMALVRQDKLTKSLSNGCQLLQVRMGPETEAISYLPEGMASRIALDHSLIVEAAIKKLRDGLEWSLLPFRLLPDEFTLRQLQDVHTAILGHPVDRATFRKRMLKRTFANGSQLVTTGEQEWADHRPASIFRLGNKEVWR